MTVISFSNRQRRALFGAAGVVLSGAALPACSQTAEPLRTDVVREEPTQNRPIVVTGEGLEPTPGEPAYGAVEIDRDALLRAASGRIEDVLQGVAGFQQFRRSDSRAANPSAQGAALRGLGGNASSRSLVLVDGIPQANPFFGYIPYAALPPERLARIVVTRGGGSGAFGAGAVAGTIAMESAGAAMLDLVNGSAFVNERGGTEASISMAPELGSGFAVVSGRWDRGPGFFTTPVAQRVPASAKAAYGSWSLAVRGVAPVNEAAELQVRAAAFDDRRTLRFDGADSTSSGQDLSLRLTGGSNWQFDALGYVQLRDFSNVVISSTRFVKVLDQRATPALGLGGKLELRPPTGTAHTLRFGADLRIADGELREEAYSAFTQQLTAMRRAGGRNTDAGFYVQDDWRIGDVVLTGSARLDHFVIADGFFREQDGSGMTTIADRFASRSGWEESLRGGVLYNVSSRISLRGAVYSGLRLPTLNELYRPYVVFPVVTQANAALENERLFGYETGLDYRTGRAAISLTAFDNRLKNAISNVTIGDNLRRRRNIEAISSRGVELDGNVRWTHGFASLSAAYLDAQNEASGDAADLNGLRPAQVPKFAVSATAGITPHAGVDLSVTVRHEGRRYEDDINSNELAAATTLDAFASFAVTDQTRLLIRGENLLDEEIITRNQQGSIDLGTPRTLWIGVRTTFDR
ncbi:TonB-dependent receptor [Croceicoccus sp. F390]|uniref:TonB-dependent receptor n=1 Tax=Croceicoccus esteveae TaxID=3075597 RepID=A0ABU2ZE64_9SPHN|nr:TonB-dependent receptor [Croceicoccus sp. F390]MDT0574665.1 TonB-dependent receptor [Croceicoccus sp. F390]